MLIDNYQLEQTVRRFNERRDQRARNEQLIRKRRYLEVDSKERVRKFLDRRGLALDANGMPVRERSATLMAGEVAALPDELAFERYLGTNDLMGVAFLNEGLRVSRTVARIWVDVAAGRPRGYGTGFMVSPRLMITNNHVLGEPGVAERSIAEFGYELAYDGSALPTTAFRFDPSTFFYTDRDLDYAVVAVQTTASDGKPLAQFDYNLLSDQEGKAIAAQWANIIQHPSGGPKEVSLRENQIIDVLPNFLHYKSDTAPGSSGSPVYNDRWEVVALHHSGVPQKNADGQLVALNGQVWRPEMGDDQIKWIANEGVRISRIIAHLRGRLTSEAHRALLDAALTSDSNQRPTVTPGEQSMASYDQPASVRPDGSATWTIPLTVTVNVGGQRPSAPLAPSAATAGAPPPAPAAPARPSPADANQQALNAARVEFKKLSGNVMDVRLGYKFVDGRITKERALVVTVRRKLEKDELSAAGMAMLPDTYRGLPVQVTDPTIPELLQQAVGPYATESLDLDQALATQEITYVPPTNPGLNRVKAKMRVTAHVSPDAGWAQLEPFLGKTAKSLVVAMYDFGAPHILKAIDDLKSKKGVKDVTLTIQPGQSLGTGTSGVNPKAHDLKDADVVKALTKAFGKRFKVAWVKIGLVNGWVASSYHIKVAVRDQGAFWLSSGNWQSSNQPDGDPLKKPWDRKWLSQYNREWHAIVEHPGMAADFEKYIRYDYQNNIGNADEALALPDLLVPEEAFEPTLAEKQTPFQYFEPFTADREFDVQPLLTPDNFLDHAIELVESAKSELCIQNQTFNAPNDKQKDLDRLIEAVLKKQQDNVPIRIIFRLFKKADARKNLEALQDYGFDMANVRVQKNCHTKGVIVDRKRVMVGSQNWSAQGVSLNRDASLIFYDEELAKYFAQIFDHDWANLATDSIDVLPSGVEIAPAGDVVPEGYVKISAEEYLESL
jgi:V8-like Glu-specific endopeptidase